jgi:hypothetical protein
VKFGRVPTYNVAEIEAKAADLLRQTFPSGLELSIDVEHVLESVPNVFFDLWPGLRGNHQVEGMVCRDTATGELCVYVDDDLADNNPNRYRMTVAEELGHVILHRAVIDKVTSPEDFCELQRHDKWREMDRNAKRFAAALLMPADKLLEQARDWYPRLISVAGFNNPDAVINQLISKLAKHFEVSLQAMGYRFNEWPAKLREKIVAAMQDKLNYI